MSKPSVVVKESSVARARTSDSEFQFIRFKDAAEGADPWPAVIAWATDLVERAGDTVGDPGVMGYFPVDDRTVVIGLQYASSRKTLLAECARLQDHLEQAGCVGVIENAPPARDPLRRQWDDPFFATAVVLSPNTRPWRPPNGNPAWNARVMLQPDALAAVVEHAIGWCLVPNGQHYVRVGLYGMRVPSDRAGDVVRKLIATTGDSVVLTCSAWPERSRVVTFTEEAHVIYAEGNGNGYPPPGDSVALATELLTDLAPQATYGFAVQTAAAVTVSAFNLLSGGTWPTPHMPARLHTTARRWEVVGGWDAFACLLHGPDFPPVPADGPFQVSELSAGRHLLVHRDAARWIDGHTLRTPEELAHARAALADALLDPEALEIMTPAWAVAQGDVNYIREFGPDPLIPDDHPMKTW